MKDLIPPHGGVSEPVDRTVPAAETADFTARAQALKRLPISDADLSTLYRLGDGGLSPLTGPMDKATFDRVLDEEVIVRDGKKYAWSIPLAFPADMATAKEMKPGETVALVNGRGEVVGTLEVKDV
jgi:sulfate adenylyltransferase